MVDSINLPQNACMCPQPHTCAQHSGQPQQVVSPCVSVPNGTASAVNIQIFNPTAYAGDAPPQAQTSSIPSYYPQANFYNGQGGHMPYPYQPINMSQSQSQTINQPAPQVPTAATTEAQQSAPQAQIPPPPQQPETQKEAKANEKKVVLTDDYIKSLENYLNNENPKVRMMGVKELMARFKEDKTRATDVALTALLNKALQDPSSTVKFMGLTVLDCGYAKGNEETIQLLQQIQTQKTELGSEDALLASEILLKNSGETVETPAGTGYATPKKESDKA